MKLKLIREEFNDICTIGKLFINDEFFCYTLEDKDRGLKDSDPLPLIVAKKVFGKTAIPKGKYKLIVNESPKFKRVLPRILNTKGFTGVLMHRGNSAEHSLGCILVGFKKSVNSIFESTQAENKLVNLLMLHGGDHELEIV